MHGCALVERDVNAITRMLPCKQRLCGEHRAYNEAHATPNDAQQSMERVCAVSQPMLLLVLARDEQPTPGKLNAA